MLRVGLDVTELAMGSGQRGVGTYIREIMRGLQQRDDISLTVVAPRGWASPAGVEVTRVLRLGHHRVGPGVTGMLLPWDISRAGVDVFHSPGFSPPRHSRTPVVQTLYDLTPLVFDHPLLARDARLWRKRGPAMRAADRVIAISHSTASQGERLLDLDPARMVTVPLAVAADFTPGAPTGAITPGLLAVSSWGPHKGFKEASQVLDGLRDRGIDMRLRIVGHHDAWMREHLEADLAGSRHRDSIDIVGWTPDLADEYRSAALVLVTSRAEGYGLPAAEALACGATVVAFDNTSLTEVVGERGTLVPDGDVAAMVDACAKLLDDAAPATLPTEVPRRTWADVVEDHVRVYRDAARR